MTRSAKCANRKTELASVVIRVKHQVSIGVWTDRANFDARTFLVADRHPHHGTAIDGRSLNLVGCFKMRIQTAIRIHAGIQQQTKIVAMGQNAIAERPRKFAQLLLALWIPEKVFAFLADGNIGVHAATVDANHRLGKERRGTSHAGCHLAAN